MVVQAREAVREVILDGVRCPLVGDGKVTFSDLARFQPKVLFGDPSKDDNDLLSVWQISDHSGGSGVLDMKEGTDQGRYYMSTLYGRFPGQLTKPGYFPDNSPASAEGSGNKMILGEMWSSNVSDFVPIYTAGVGVRRGRIDTSTSNMLDPTYPNAVCNNLTLGDPVNKGVAFQGTFTEERFFIPLGNGGWARLEDTGTTLTETASPAFSHFCVWDSKLIGITTGGRLYKTVDGTTWTPYDLTYQLSKSYRIRGMVNYFDRRDEPCIYIITDRDMWQFDPDGPELFRIDHSWGTHPYHGRASISWNGQLFISVGMGVMRYSGGAWMPVGLDRDHGIPSEYGGYIMDFAANHNSLYALVQGTNFGSTYGAKSSIHEFSGSGWQCVWNDDTAIPASIQDRSTLAWTPFTVTGIHVTQSRSKQTLVLSTAGVDDHLYTSPLQLQNANARTGITQGQLFGSGAWYFWESSEFDADMEQYVKIGNSFSFTLEEPIAQTDAMRDDFLVYYRIDRGSWVLAATYTTADPGSYTFGLGSVIANTSFTQGIEFKKIQFRVALDRQASYNADKPTIISNMVFSFLKTVSSNDAMQVAIDVHQGAYANGYSPNEFAAWIDSLTSLKRFCAMTVEGITYRVFVSQNTGDRFPGGGDTQMGIRQLSIIEIPTNT